MKQMLKSTIIITIIIIIELTYNISYYSISQCRIDKSRVE
jgi:hypothetical protein